MLGGVAVAGAELGPGDIGLVGGAAATIMLYKNKDAITKIIGQMDHAVEHIGFLNNSPHQDPRNHWRKEIRDAIATARKWANRMSPGKAQDIYLRLINAVENAVPQD